MLCPNCKTENLVTSERQNVEIDHCPRCKGVWLDRGELEKLIQMASSDDERQSDRVNGREFSGDDEDMPRGRGSRDIEQDDDDDDTDSERTRSGRSGGSADDDDDDRQDRRDYRAPDRDDDQRDTRGQGQGKSIWREIFDNLEDKLPGA